MPFLENAKFLAFLLLKHDSGCLLLSHQREHAPFHCRMFVDGDLNIVYLWFKSLLRSGSKPDESPALKNYFLPISKVRLRLLDLALKLDYLF